MQTEPKNNNNNHSCNLKTSNNYMFNLIQSAPPRVKFRDTVDIATIRNDSHHIHGISKKTIHQQAKNTAQPVRSVFPHKKWHSVGGRTINRSTIMTKP